MRRAVMVVMLVVGVTAVPEVASAGESDPPTCLGRPATIAGAGAVTGTAGDDVILGSDAGDTIDARSGNDLICGLAGDDTPLAIGKRRRSPAPWRAARDSNPKPPDP